MRTRNLSPKPKNNIALALLCWLALTVTAFAQPTNMPALYQPTLLTYTNAIPDNTNYAVPSGVIGSIYVSEIGVYCAYQRSGDGTNGVTFPFSAGLWQSNLSPVFAAYLPANGTNLVWTNFTVDILAMGYFAFDGPNVSSNGNSVSNLQIYLTPKPSRRDKF